jgi:hypothetical protein
MEAKADNWEAKWWPLWLLFAVVILLWSLSWWLITSSQLLASWELRGTFGDMFGAVNSLFSGLAFAGVIYAILLQRRELQETREELRRTADAQERSEMIARENSYLSAMAAILNAETAKMQRATGGSNAVVKALERVDDYQNTLLAFVERTEEDIERARAA